MEKERRSKGKKNQRQEEAKVSLPDQLEAAGSLRQPRKKQRAPKREHEEVNFLKFI